MELRKSLISAENIDIYKAANDAVCGEEREMQQNDKNYCHKKAVFKSVFIT